MFKVRIDRNTLSFTMDDPKPMSVSPIESVGWFSADGPELDMIRDQFNHLPTSLFSSCIWSGEMAGFIYRNLRTLPEQGVNVAKE